jgi:glycosyltransferase involved in cell wall biosynthesis
MRAMADANLTDLATAKPAVVTPAAANPAARTDGLFLLNNLGVGGSERKIVRLANRLKDEGVQVSLVSLNGPYTIEAGIRRDVPLKKLERKGKFSWRALLRLREIIVRERPATILAVNLYQALYVALATLFLPYRPRTVALVNTSTFRGHRLLKRLYQAVLARFDLTVHGCDAQRQFWLRPNRRAPDNSTVIYNGVDSDHFEINGSFEAAKRLRASLGVAPDSFLMGTVGRLAPEKNQAVLLTALHRLRASRIDAHLVLAGGGALREALLRQARELAIADRVHFIGEIDDVRPVLAALDVFVLPSVAVESFSNAALEAMSMGRPVILSDIGGAREMIQEGVEGYVVSHTELAARLPAILSALYADKRKRQLMGVAARARAATCFSVPAMIAGYRGLLNNGDLQ